MNNLRDKLYDIKDLRIVMINKNYIEQTHDDYINYFNENVKLIAEKLVIETKDDTGKTNYSEYYMECITEEDLSFRTSKEPFTTTPKIFSVVSRIPTEFLTDEEFRTGKITTMRIFKILQDINIEKKKKNSKRLQKK